MDHTLVRSILWGLLSLSIIIISFCVSIFLTRDPADAGRGGAVVVAISFYFILQSRDVHPLVSSEDGKKHIQSLLDKEANRLLSLMSIVGTLAWGFLDILAKFFISAHA